MFQDREGSTDQDLEEDLDWGENESTDRSAIDRCTRLRMGVDWALEDRLIDPLEEHLAEEHLVGGMGVTGDLVDWGRIEEEEEKVQTRRLVLI
jgi:hypothetical protein